MIALARRLPFTAVITSVLAAACATTGGGEIDGTVSPAVLDALRTDDSVRVVVALVPPADADADPRAEIARRQDDVLASLDPADFRLRRRFTAVPAMTGTLLTERGARILAGHPHVAHVGLDGGAGGGGGP